jgi:hypothetical protein
VTEFEDDMRRPTLNVRRQRSLTDQGTVDLFAQARFTEAPHLHPIYLTVIGDRIAPRSRLNEGYEVFDEDGRPLGLLVKCKPHQPRGGGGLRSVGRAPWLPITRSLKPLSPQFTPSDAAILLSAWDYGELTRLRSEREDAARLAEIDEEALADPI